MCQIACNKEMSSSHFCISLAAHGWLTNISGADKGKDKGKEVYFCEESMKICIQRFKGMLSSNRS